MSSRQSTPPPRAALQPKSPLTPEQVRRIEINRLRAKALREHREAEAAPAASLNRPGSTLAGQKRSFAAYSGTPAPATNRDARNDTNINRPLEAIQPARNFAKYVDYDFSKMADTKGGFLTQEDDPHNKVLHADEKDQKPANMTQKEWERQVLLRSLRNRQTGPFEPGITVMTDQKVKSCRECGTLEVDWKWLEIFSLAVCNTCKDKFPEKYSLLTKTEAKEDYLLTEPELKDERLLPHLERPNPHKSTWHNMFLYLRCQIEEYAFSEKKWGSAEALDGEFGKRETEKKKRKENKFKSKLADLKKRTRVEAYQRSKKGGAPGNFGDDMSGGKHVHEFGQPIDNPETGFPVKTCTICGLEVEELEL